MLENTTTYKAYPDEFITLDLFTIEIKQLYTPEKKYIINQYNLGIIYFKGKEVEQDYKKAINYFKEVAEEGYENAQNNLGIIYINAHGIEQDYKKAREWFEKAAKQGNAKAQNNLGWMYATAHGVEQDYKKAREWYEKAAKQGNAKAQNNLGWMYDNAFGVEQDYNKAREWYEEAAKQGNEAAQKDLKKLLAKFEEQKAQICKENEKSAKEIENKEESTKQLQNEQTNLVNSFTSLSPEAQERAIEFSNLNEDEQKSYLSSFNESATLSVFDELKSNYKPFPDDQKTTVDNIQAHLKPQLKDYVKAWGAKEDLIYLDDLREIEPLTTKMYQAFYRANKKDSSSPLLSDLIAKQTQKVTKRLNSFKPTDQATYKEHKQNMSAISRRERKDNNTLIEEPI
ncbi:MAG: hypothetical protein GQ532_14280 [Methylomarinum sp.]|nr:hypothetical protein [Methylomarinum sp.]